MPEPVRLPLNDIKSSLPTGGVFTKEWRNSPIPLTLNKDISREIRSLGHILGKFYETCNDLYNASSRGTLHSWIADLLDRGKPADLLNHQKSSPVRQLLPRVIRPDLMITDNGLALTELDSVPGGIGITLWLSRLYASYGWDIAGGADGMKEGFLSILPNGADILVSEESSDYLPEMRYLADSLGDTYQVRHAENYQANTSREAYRFFELFDLPNIPGARELIHRLPLTPPAKPHLEEKLWLALFHTPGLKSEWKKRLRESHLHHLEKLFPHSWTIDPAPLPPQAALPWLNVNNWDEVARMSQKQRRLVVKISGFHEKAWGARGVHIGHDLPSAEWAQVLSTALQDYSSSPWLMQEFISSSLLEHPYYDLESGEERLMRGFARITPYYFRPESGQVTLGGCMATIVPADKKKIHGMADAILVPCLLTH